MTHSCMMLWPSTVTTHSIVTHISLELSFSIMLLPWQENLANHFPESDWLKMYNLQMFKLPKSRWADLSQPTNNSSQHLFLPTRISLLPYNFFCYRKLDGEQKLGKWNAREWILFRVTLPCLTNTAFSSLQSSRLQDVGVPIFGSSSQRQS